MNLSFLMKMRTSLFALCLCASQAMATQVAFNFEARITAISDASAFSGLQVGDYFGGSFGYDTAQAPTQNFGWWMSQYDLSSPNGFFRANPGRPITVTELKQTYVLNGPAFPTTQIDAFVLRSDAFFNGGAFAAPGQSVVNLELVPIGSAGPLQSTALPATLSLADFPYSGGIINTVVGAVPPSGTYNYLNNAVYFQGVSGASNLYSFGLLGYPLTYAQPMSSNGYAIGMNDYVAYLDGGGPKISVEGIAFQLTSISPVPELDVVVLLLLGAPIVRIVAHRARQRSRALVNLKNDPLYMRRAG